MKKLMFYNIFIISFRFHSISFHSIRLSFNSLFLTVLAKPLQWRFFFSLSLLLFHVSSRNKIEITSIPKFLSVSTMIQFGNGTLTSFHSSLFLFEYFNSFHVFGKNTYLSVIYGFSFMVSFLNYSFI